MSKAKTEDRPDVRSKVVMDRLETEVAKLEHAVETLRDVLARMEVEDDDRR